MKNRKGRLALREIIIIIVIVVVLAGVSVPYYLRRVQTMRMDRVISDFAYLASHLDEFRTDWGCYPIVPNGEYFGKNTDGIAIMATITRELTGSATAAPYINIPGNVSLTDREGGIEYIEIGKILLLYNPFNSTQDYYYRTDERGTKWVLSLFLPNGKVLYRTNHLTTVTEADVAPIP